VLVAYNGSLESAKAMKQFVQFALWPDATLEIVCVGNAKTREPTDQMLAEAAAYCRAHGFEARPVRLTSADHPHAALRDRAEGGRADLIVLGSSFRRILLTERFGRNAIALIEKSPVPLFLSH
jgi:nucleotide-binding universal stress UspA family protein